MTPRTLLHIVAPLLHLTAFWSQGCTVIGYGLGSLRDHSSASYVPKDSLDYVDLEDSDPSGEATVLTADGILYRGMLRGLIETPDSLFALQVAQWRSRNPASPYCTLLSGAIHLRTDNPYGIYSGDLAGLSMDAIRLRGRTRTGRAETIQMDRVRSLTDTTGRMFDRDSLLMAVEQREIPVSKSMRLYDSSGHRTLIPWHEVRYISGKARDVPVTGRIVGTALGLGADIAIVAIAIANFKLGPFRGSLER